MSTWWLLGSGALLVATFYALANSTRARDAEERHG